MSSAGQGSEICPSFLLALRRFEPGCLKEVRDRQFILDFAETRPFPFDRKHLDAHLTGSALVISSDGKQILLGFHRKLGRWLQMGGHGDPGETCPQHVAFREAGEESGIPGLSLHPSAPAPLDLDVHEIPERGAVPAHLHLDVRYLLVAPAGAEPVHRADEHLQVRWWGWTDAEALDLDPNLRRMLAKAASFAGV